MATYVRAESVKAALGRLEREVARLEDVLGLEKGALTAFREPMAEIRKMLPNVTYLLMQAEIERQSSRAFVAEKKVEELLKERDLPILNYQDLAGYLHNRFCTGRGCYYREDSPHGVSHREKWLEIAKQVVLQVQKLLSAALVIETNARGEPS